MEQKLFVMSETWPLVAPFRISRGVKTEAQVVVAMLDCLGVRGRGEAVPYARYDETVETVLEAVERLRDDLAGGLSREDLLDSLPAGAARNALDCAMWDQQARWKGTTVARLLEVPENQKVVTAVTLGIDSAERMAEKAARLRHCPLLKVKLDREDIIARVSAIRKAAPKARLILDPNESWDMDVLREVDAPLAALGVDLLEQPLPAEQDDGLAEFQGQVPVCADESCHTRQDLAGLKDKYQVINIKLDKSGGLTEALALKKQARKMGFGIMVGCMVGTSLAMAPALMLAHDADFVDLDGPLWMARDRTPGLSIQDGIIGPLPTGLWGSGAGGAV
ncbi:N-acetyl-D-Glu racemase DgcA [Luteithermobacter gelatinilyticus]|uniref:N-acetyl-D-Glu racemase DgcA n=1 Tax=Luteithermobacter gelatinilyticus TaxID=2582913 RepID=UPI00110665B6|nr:N-acetyl-D-Glu racemase DgcA [Luteithermobacter gelatinilyticus]